jgi:hypothetical protein
MGTRRLLLPAVFVLGVGCFLLWERGVTDPAEWPAYLGLISIVLAVCVAAALETIHRLHKRVEELERTLSDRQSRAASAHAPGSALSSGPAVGRKEPDHAADRL